MNGSLEIFSATTQSAADRILHPGVSIGCFDEGTVMKQFLLGAVVTYVILCLIAAAQENDDEEIHFFDEE